MRAGLRSGPDGEMASCAALAAILRHDCGRSSEFGLLSIHLLDIRPVSEWRPRYDADRRSSTVGAASGS